MKEKHKWYDVIVAWASGEDIQFRLHGVGDWETYIRCTYTPQPDFRDSAYEWRIKPKVVNKIFRTAIIENQGVQSVILVDVTKNYPGNPVSDSIEGFVRYVGECISVDLEVNE